MTHQADDGYDEMDTGSPMESLSAVNVEVPPLTPLTEMHPALSALVPSASAPSASALSVHSHFDEVDSCAVDQRLPEVACTKKAKSKESSVLVIYTYHHYLPLPLPSGPLPVQCATSWELGRETHHHFQ